MSLSTFTKSVPLKQNYDDAQEKIVSTVERKTKEAKKEAQQAKLPKVKWGPDPVKNC